MSDHEPTRAVLFDWDGTLIDSRETLLAAWHASTTAVLGRRFPATPQEETAVFTLPGTRIWPRLVRDAAQQEELVARFQESYELHADRVTAFPGVPAMLDELRAAGVAIAVVTSKARRRFVPDSVNAGIADAIDAAACVDDVAAAKPDARHLFHALDLLAIDAAHAVMVGDTPVDVAAGLAAGTSVIGVTWGHCSGEELGAAGAAMLADSPADVVRLVLDGAAIPLSAPTEGHAP